MSHFNLGNHHQHKRKLVHQKLEKYPHPDKFVKNYDKFMYLLGIGIPILTSSQVFKIWFSKDASGISLIAWSAYLFNSIAWLYYGYLHKEKPIIFTNIICTLINLAVVIGTMLYA